MPEDKVKLRAFLFDADAGDRRIDEDAIDLSLLGEHQLLWIDVQDDEHGGATPILEKLCDRLGIDGASAELEQLAGKPRLRNYGGWFLVEVSAVECDGHLGFKGRALVLICGPNFVLSLHRGPLEILDELYERERGETRIGTLHAQSFTVSLLDWQVDSYLHAVSELEEAVDRLEVAILGRDRYPECLAELVRMRRGASRLRRMLAPHRHVFGALARPDFRPDDDDDSAERRFAALEQRFERAMDAVEIGRELVVGSFELYTTRSAQRTNDTMRVLTFVTVLLGTLAVVAGALGMNFKAPLFESGAAGFRGSLAAMGVFAIVALVVARLKRWM